MARLTRKTDGRPAIQFYITDYLRDTRILSAEARGVWMDLICLMFISPTRGVLSINGVKPEISDISKAINVDIETTQRCIDEILQWKVAEQSEKLGIYSRRMYREYLKGQKEKLNRSKAQRERRDKERQDQHKEGGSITSSLSSTSTININNKEVSDPPQFNSEGPEVKLSQLLCNLILKNNPTAQPKPNGWPKVVDAMLRIQGRTPEHIEKLVRWSQADDFWCANILSMGKLKKQFDRLTVEMSKGKRTGWDKSKEGIQEYAKRIGYDG